MEKLRLCFAGTPAFAAAHLQSLLQANLNVVAVYTQPERPSGRGKKRQASPVRQIAQQYSLPVYQPVSLKSAAHALALSALDVDILIVVAYGLILPKPMLAVPKFGCLNVHASLLPRWRGAAPIERALLAGDKVSGVTIMQMDEGLDTGAILDKESITIENSDNRVDVEQKLTTAGQIALLRTLANLQEYRANAVAQIESESCYAAKLDKAEALIDWSLPAQQIDRQIRAGIGRTPAYTFLGNQRLRILEARVSGECFEANPGRIVSASKKHFTVCCESSSITVTRVQLPGKNPATVQAIANSRPALFRAGAQFTAAESGQPESGQA